MNTIITEKTPNGDISYDVFAKLTNDRIIFLSDYIDDEVATNIVATLLYLDGVNSDQISLYINSEGGDIRAVFMIYDVLQMLRAPIRTVCLGSATLASVLILAAGTKGLRAATKSSIICVGQLANDGLTFGDLPSIKISFEQMKKDNKKLIDALAKHTGKKTSIVARDCERKVFMNPTQAKRYGIIDKILEWNK